MCCVLCVVLFCLCGGCLQDFWPLPQLCRAPPPDRPSPGPPKVLPFFFSLPPEISFFLLSPGGLFVEFWWCFEGWGCETRFGAAGASHDNQRTPNMHMWAPRRFKHHKIPREDPRERGAKMEVGDGKKEARNFGPPNPWGPHPFGPPTLREPHPSGPPPKQKIGQMRSKFGQQKLAQFGQIKLAECGQLTLAQEMAKFGLDK